MQGHPVTGTDRRAAQYLVTPAAATRRVPERSRTPSLSSGTSSQVLLGQCWTRNTQHQHLVIGLLYHAGLTRNPLVRQALADEELHQDFGVRSRSITTLVLESLPSPASLSVQATSHAVSRQPFVLTVRDWSTGSEGRIHADYFLYLSMFVEFHPSGNFEFDEPRKTILSQIPMPGLRVTRV